MISYDGFLPLTTSWTGVINGTVGRTYNNDFRVTSLSVNGSPVAYTYDADGLITGAGNLAVSRDARNGLITGSTLGGIATANTFNVFGELASERHTGSGAALFDVQYTRDKLGRITQKVETVGGITSTHGYVYDSAGRLVQVTKDGAVVSAYAYDQNGNRIGKTDAIGTTAGTHDAQDRLLTWGTNAYTYTANGEPLTKTSPQGTTSYTYDVLGNLVSATLPDGTLIEYIVDGANRRVGKKVNGVLTQGWLYANQLNPVAELDGAGNVVATFVYGTKGNVPDYVIKNGVTYRIISDHLGSPRLVVDSTTGTIAQDIEYDEFGNVLSDTNPGFQPFGFAGGLYDQHTKLVRFGARDYDAETGRWTAKDPIRFAGGDTNLYGYVLNDPVNFIDPRGLYTVSFGITFSVSAFGFSASGGVSFNVGYDGCKGWSASATKTSGVGASTGFQASGGVAVAGTNAKTVDDLLGKSVETTISGKLPVGLPIVSAGGSIATILGGNNAYQGVGFGVSGGVSLPINAGVSTGVTYTTPLSAY